MMTRIHEVAVVGGGVIGLSVAWRAAQAGYSVSLIDPRPARGASWIAGGMLAPVTEAWPGEEDLLRLGEQSLRRWPDFARELDKSGADPGLANDGTVVAALDHADAEALDMLGQYLGTLGREATVLSRREARRHEPGLAPAVRGALLVPGDLAVDNRELLDALTTACAAAGVEFVAEAAVELAPGLVRTATATHPCDATVLAAGAWSSRLHPELGDKVRPLKGEILRVAPRRTTLSPPTHTLRAAVEGRPIYLVPRADGTAVLGATQYEAGFDQTVTAGGVRRLLDDAERIFPGIAEYELLETAAGSRASSVDNLPLIGRLRDGVIAATGHHRNGLLLAPITADAVLAELADTAPPRQVLPARPARFDSTRGEP